MLRSLPFGEQGLSRPGAAARSAPSKRRSRSTAFEHLASDLASGLKSGDMDVLQSAVETAAGQEAGLAPEVRADLDRARGAVEAYAQARAASGRGEHAQVLERFAALTAHDLPSRQGSDPDGLRDKAAQALETQADALAARRSTPRPWPSSDRSRRAGPTGPASRSGSTATRPGSAPRRSRRPCSPPCPPSSAGKSPGKGSRPSRASSRRPTWRPASPRPGPGWRTSSPVSTASPLSSCCATATSWTTPAAAWSS